MKIMAKLAYSQLKINRSRSLWTMAGIILSTALCTTVCSLAASCIAAVSSFYGPHTGDNWGIFTPVFTVLVSILGVLIISMSVIVISNAFRVSANERTAQFGILKSVGATKRQITMAVMYESIWLSLAGIPTGIACGLLLYGIGIRVVNYFLVEINRLTNVMVQDLTIELSFIIVWQALLAAILISFFTTILSAWLPARKAAKTTAIDSIRGAGTVHLKRKTARVNFLIKKLFGFEGVLASKNMKRNKRNFRASVKSLTIGIILTISLYSVGEQFSAIEAFLYKTSNGNVTVDYLSIRDESITDITGMELTRIAVPITSETANQVTEKLREYSDTSIFGYGSNMETYVSMIPAEMITPAMKEVISDKFAEEYPTEQSVYKLPTEIITIDPENYALLCKKAGVPLDSNILLNHYSYNNNGYETILSPFLHEKGELQFMQADGTVHKTPFHGMLEAEEVPGELIYLDPSVVRVIVPNGEMRGYNWMAETGDIDGFIAYANKIMDETFPRDQEAYYVSFYENSEMNSYVSSYARFGFSTRVFESNDYMKVMNMSIVIASVVAWSFTIMLILIGLISVITTILMNVRKRSREFAVLQSIGMTYEGVKRMLDLESILCSVKSLTIGVPAAIALTYFINIPIRAIYPVPYRLPWLALVWCIIGISVITWLTMRYSASRLRSRSLVETIRSESE